MDAQMAGMDSTVIPSGDEDEESCCCVENKHTVQAREESEKKDVQEVRNESRDQSNAFDDRFEMGSKGSVLHF